ncbi:MAG: hypothetical protein COB37_10760 [Kordiimonadales bacterium]|nr:MAG: hypothetical protein COB37_10760 [Kordiimonadales bacterium]
MPVTKMSKKMKSFLHITLFVWLFLFLSAVGGALATDGPIVLSGLLKGIGILAIVAPFLAAGEIWLEKSDKKQKKRKKRRHFFKRS